MKKILFACATLMGLAMISCNDNGEKPGPGPGPDPNPFPAPGSGNTSYMEINGTKHTIPLGTGVFDALYFVEHEDRYEFAVDFYQGYYHPSFKLVLDKDLTGKTVTLAEGESRWALAFCEQDGGWGFEGDNERMNSISEGILRLTRIGDGHFRVEADVDSKEGDQVKIYFQGKLRNATPAKVGTVKFNGDYFDLANDGVLTATDYGYASEFRISSSFGGSRGEFVFSVDNDLIGQAARLEAGEDIWAVELSHGSLGLTASNENSEAIASGDLKIVYMGGGNLYKIECELTSAEGDEFLLQFNGEMDVVPFVSVGAIGFNDDVLPIPDYGIFDCDEYVDRYEFTIQYSAGGVDMYFRCYMDHELIGTEIPLAEGGDRWGVHFKYGSLDLSQDEGNAANISSGLMKVASPGNAKYKIECLMTTASGDEIDIRFEGRMNEEHH